MDIKLIAKLLVLKTQVKIPDVSHTSLTPSPPGALLLWTMSISGPSPRPILLRIPNPGCPTFIRDVPRRVVQAEVEPLLRRGTLPGQTSDKRKE